MRRQDTRSADGSRGDRHRTTRLRLTPEELAYLEAELDRVSRRVIEDTA